MSCRRLSRNRNLNRNQTVCCFAVLLPICIAPKPKSIDDFVVGGRWVAVPAGWNSNSKSKSKLKPKSGCVAALPGRRVAIGVAFEFEVEQWLICRVAWGGAVLSGWNFKSTSKLNRKVVALLCRPGSNRNRNRKVLTKQSRMRRNLRWRGQY